MKINLTQYCTRKSRHTCGTLGASRDVCPDFADIALVAGTCARVCTLLVDTGLVCSAVFVV